MLMRDGSLICWNCCGAKSSNFIREMKEMKMKYKPMLIILIEQKISGIKEDDICKKLGKTH